MLRSQGVRSGPVIGLVSAHKLNIVDPYTAWLVSDSQINHVVPSTRSGYETGINSYLGYCSVRNLKPWPVTEVAMAGWMLITAQRIKHTSLRKYMSGLPYGQAIQPSAMPWTVTGSEVIRKAMRYIKHRHPCEAKRTKLPITLQLIRQLATALPGFPVLSNMVFEDLLWLSASVTATSAFLRAGEFLYSTDSDRATLSMADVDIRDVGGVRTMVVSPPQPKTRMDLSSVSIPCFAPESAGPLHPITLFEAYKAASLRLAAGYTPARTPAFHFASGLPLSKLWMLSRTRALMDQLHIAVVCPEGKPTKINASSWRAGGVASALKARLSDSMIMEFGRWRSSAWKHYLMFSPLDLQGACRRMWEASGGDGAVGSVSMQEGGSFDRLMPASAAAAAARAKSQLKVAIFASTSVPADRLAQSSAAFAMIDATIALLV
jgi:hypothetical protein